MKRLRVIGKFYVYTSFFTIIFLTLSCNKTNLEYGFLNNLNYGIEVKFYKTCYLTGYLEYPKQTLVLLKGDSIELVSFLNDLGLEKYSFEMSSANKGIIPNEYYGDKLWVFNGSIGNCFKKRIINSVYIKNSYAAYFCNKKEPITSMSIDSKWNGKIVAYIKGNSCHFLIEELWSPDYK